MAGGLIKHLKYGLNSHQAPAEVVIPCLTDGTDSLEVLNGNPGTINLYDALNGWQLVRELSALGLPAAASFKHVSPAGAALGLPLSETLAKAYAVDDMDLSPLATAYARARGADPVSSFGDFAALSDICDVETARLLKREVSDGVIAPGYEPAALELLKEKREGNYSVLQIDPDYQPSERETREIFGFKFTQPRNTAVLNADTLTNIVTENKDLPDDAIRDLLVALITLKYTQSNSVDFAYGGQAIGVGAGQQSRIHCTRLAAHKADLWWLRQDSRILELPFRDGLKRPERNNLIDLFLSEWRTPQEARLLHDGFKYPITPFTDEERALRKCSLTGVSLGSDAFFPFRDSLDRASQSGVVYVAQPGGSDRDSEVITAANEHRMVMVMGTPRLFHH